MDSGDDEFPSVWKRLDELRHRDFIREDGGVMRILCTMIDSGGIDSTTDTVYKYASRWTRERVYAVKGSSQGSTKPIYNHPQITKSKHKCYLFIVGVDKAKELIYARLRIETPGPGYCHFPADKQAGYNADYFAGLICERRLSKWINGHIKLYWWKPKEARNEPLDLRVYNLNAIKHLNPNWDVLEKQYMKLAKPDVPQRKIPPKSPTVYPSRRSGISI
jgi:phage terminase large subunit GpA-like protein